MAKTTEFGKAVKIRLIELDKTQEWLIEQVKDRTGDFFDNSYLHRLLTGKTPGNAGRGEKPGKVDVIREILGMNKEE